MKSPLFEKAAIVGLGLMGGSLGLAMRESGIARRIAGYARSEETRAAAVATGLVDTAPSRLEEAVDAADLLVLATPLLSYDAILRAAVSRIGAACLVTDLGSAKGEAVRTCEAILNGSGRPFVGGHPMTGSEESGPGAARADLYRGAVWCLTPTRTTDGMGLARAQMLAESAGSRVIVLSPEEHDLAVAAASHVPHLAAVALVSGLDNVSESAPAAVELTAGGFRDTTRVASGSPEMWRDICLSNREAILVAMKAFRAALEVLESAVERGDGEALAAYLNAAKTVREAVIKRK